MRYLIIGGNGFIGSHLVDKLLVEGHTIRVLDRNPEKFRKPLSLVDYQLGLNTDESLLSNAIKDIDVIIHLASTTVPGTSNDKPVADIDENLIPFVKMLIFAVKEGVKKIVFFSSGGAVYGEPEHLPIPETHPLRPMSSYGILKMTMEAYLSLFRSGHGIEYSIIRPSNAYGPRQGKSGVQGLIGTILTSALLDKPITIWGDGSIIRDYIYVDDLVELCYLASLRSNSGIFNAGSGQGLSIKELLKIIAESFGLSPTVRFEDVRRSDPQRIVLDISHAQTALGWTPKTRLNDGIRYQLAWLEQNIH